MHFSFVTFGLCCLLVFCSHGFVIKSDENSIDFSAAKKPTIHFSVETETNEEIEELEFISGKYKENIPIQQSQEYEYVLPESFQITSGRAFSFEIAAIISEKKCISSTDSYRMNLICEDEERIKTISAKIGLNAQQSEMLSSPNTCFDEQNELWDSCTTDFTQYVSMKCNHLQACFPFEEALSFKTSCDALLNPFASVSYSCSRSHSFKKTVCFQLDLTKSNNYFASLVPDTELYPLLKGNLVVFFTTTIPQQCATDRYPIEVSSKHQTDNPVTKTTMLESDSTIYQVDFGRATFEAYTITISFDGRQLFERTIQVSSATVITPPPTPFETSVSVSSSVTFNWKKLDPQFTSTISFDCDDFTGTAYYHYGEPMNREAAKNYCNSLDDSLLPTMRSICRQNSFFSTEHYWIGLTDVERKDTGYNIYANTYQWDDGSTVFKMLSSYDNYVWASGEPNGLNEHCYELTYGKFNDINCDTTDLPVKPFCEKRNFDCTTIEPKYTILIYDENERFLSKYQYNGIDIRTKGIDKKFTHQINGLEKNKKYLYSIRSENCGAFKQTELKPFNYCFEEAPGQIEITSYQASFLPEIRSFSFSFLLPFLGVDCSDSESETTISVTTTDDRFDCSANPKLINNSSQKSSVITCALKTNLQHSTSLFLDVSLSNGPASQSITTIKVHLCPLIAEDCPSDCLGFCQECPSIGEPSECAFPCSWCQSLNTCLSSDAFCDPCDSFGPNDCPSGCNGKCFDCSSIVEPIDCVSLCSWCQSSNSCLSLDELNESCVPCDSYSPNDCPSGCHGNCGECSLIVDPSDCVSLCSWCQSSNTCLALDAFCEPCYSFNPNDCPSGCHENCGECSMIVDPSDCVSLCSWCQSSSTCLVLDAFCKPCELFNPNDCPSGCHENCGECSLIVDPTDCVSLCSWCQSSNSCLSLDELNESCVPCDSYSPNDCPSGCHGNCGECSLIGDPSDCVSLCSWCQPSNTCLASDASCKPCYSFNPNDCPSGCHENCGECSLIGDPSDCVSLCSWCQSSNTCLALNESCDPCEAFNPNDCPSGCHGNCGECSLIGEPSDCVSLCSWCQSSSICLASNEECPSESKDSSSSTTIILLCVLIPVFVLTIFIIILALYLRKRRLQPNPIKMDDLKTSE